MRTAFLAALELAASVPGIRYVDEDFGQLEDYDIKPSIPPGSVLITVNITRTNKISATRQNVWGNVTLRFYPELVKQETSSIAPEAARARSLAYYDQVNALHKKFQGFYNDALDEFNRDSCVKERRTDGLPVVRLAYTTSWQEETEVF